MRQRVVTDITDISKTLVGGLILLLIASNSCADTINIGVGKTVANSHLNTGEIGYESNGWEVQATLIEAGDTVYGAQSELKMYSVSYITEPEWSYKKLKPFFRLGVSYNSGSVLVGRSNFKIGVGFNFNKMFRLEYVHHSSANIHRPNLGIDYIALNYLIKAPW